MHPAVLVPVKTLSRAKTRLHDHPRATLMRAFALDVLTVATSTASVGEVYVDSDEPDLTADAEALGCLALPDRGEGDLNRALVRAAAQVPPGPVAVVLGDLPALVAADLDAAVTWAADRPAVVADAAGTGTTLLLTPDGSAFAPAFGPGSYAAHVAAGHAPVPLAVPTLRRDVDTADDLRAALALGVGAHTAAALR